jgi:hypothetical protein
MKRQAFSSQVLGIDIVHAVEFSRIGCICDFRVGPTQSNFTNLPPNRRKSKRYTPKNP